MVESTSGVIRNSGTDVTESQSITTPSTRVVYGTFCNRVNTIIKKVIRTTFFLFFNIDNIFLYSIITKHNINRSYKNEIV